MSNAEKQLFGNAEAKHEPDAYRWKQLGVYCMVTVVVKALAISLLPVGIMVHRSYSERLIDVNCLALIYPVAFMIFVLPGSYFVHQ
tara:strand:+ start:56 stop:313 length:258 start_codon:yes stop_codon:yes gene_type:complete